MLPGDTKPLPERMLTSHQRYSVAFMWEQCNASAHKLNTYHVLGDYEFKITITSPRGQWVNLMIWKEMGMYVLCIVPVIVTNTEILTWISHCIHLFCGMYYYPTMPLLQQYYCGIHMGAVKTPVLIKLICNICFEIIILEWFYQWPMS